jgi:hypothetical protein
MWRLGARTERNRLAIGRQRFLAFHRDPQRESSCFENQTGLKIDRIVLLRRSRRTNSILHNPVNLV